MKIQSRLERKKITALFTAALPLISLLCGQKIEAAGMPLSYLLFFLSALAYAGFRIWDARNGNGGMWIPAYKMDFVVWALLAWNLLSIMGKMFQDPDTGAIHYQFEAVWIVVGLLYFEYKDIKEIDDWYWDWILYAGLVMLGRFLFCYLCGWETGWMAERINDSGKAASCIILVSMISVFRYCFCRVRIRSAFYLAISVISFFALFINYNIPSLWIMALVFLAIPVLFRPTAELVKRDMQLFFVYGFLLSNMSLLANYTQMLRRKPAISLEHSVYLELLLAVGGVVFFHYWDRIPEGVDMERLVLRKMRRGYRFLLVMAGIVFGILVLGGGTLAQSADAPDRPVRTALVSGFAVPLHEAVSQAKSGWICCLENSGISTLLLLFTAVLLLTEMRKNYSVAKPQTTVCQMIAMAFLAQTFFYAPDAGVLPMYLLFGVWGVFYREPRQRVTVTKINLNKGDC